MNETEWRLMSRGVVKRDGSLRGLNICTRRGSVLRRCVARKQGDLQVYWTTLYWPA